MIVSLERLVGSAEKRHDAWAVAALRVAELPEAGVVAGDGRFAGVLVA